MSKLAQQLSKQSQAKVFAKGGKVEKSPFVKAGKKVVDKDGDKMKCGGKVKK